MKTSIMNKEGGGQVEVAEGIDLRERALELAIDHTVKGGEDLKTSLLVGKAALLEKYLATGEAPLYSEVDLEKRLEISVRDLVHDLLPESPAYQQMRREITTMLERYPAALQDTNLKTKIAVMILDSLGSPASNWEDPPTTTMGRRRP